LLGKIGKAYNKMENGALMISLAIMVIVIFSQVVMRYVFNNSLSWSEELARYLFIWFSWIGVSAGYKDGEHLRVELLATNLKRRGLVKANEVLTIIVSLIWLATTLIVAYYGFEVVMAQMDLKVVTPAIKLPVWIGYMSVTFCSAVVGIRIIGTIVESLKKIFAKSNLESEVAK